MDTEILKGIGFEEKEAKIYLVLIKFGNSPASKIGEELGYDRTTTYYALLRMVEKGYVTYLIKNGVKYFQPVSPEKILSKVKESESAFSEIIPELKKISGLGQSDFSVELYKGKEGLNTLYRDIIEQGGELLSFGVDEKTFIDFDILHFKRYVKEVDRGKLKERILTHSEATEFGSNKSQYRFLSKEYFSPTPVAVYGDKVAIVVWEPTLHIVVIKSKALVKSFTNHFEFLWKIAKPVRKK
ncbi:MAG TPA: helix-turn-helix domain-containing protein [archaeon]|nr:helix-turn-helix domain-containing protein [archaeon]